MNQPVPYRSSPPPSEAATPASARRASRRPAQLAWRTVATIWAGQDEGSIPPVQLEQLRPLDRHADRNSDAEYALYRLSGRFLRYAEEYLFPHERILAFLPWSDRPADTWRKRLSRALAPGGRQPREGLLIATNRQILLLRDDEEPVAGMHFSGYYVEATTYERVHHVRCSRLDSGLHLAIEVQAAEAHETLTWLFPLEAASDVEALVTLTERFLPHPGDRRLRLPGSFVSREYLRVPRSQGHHPRNRPRSVDIIDSALSVALHERLADVLHQHPAPDRSPRRVRALAVVPDSGEGPRLIAVTQEHVILVPLPEQGEPHLFPLASVTSIVLRRSVSETHVAWRLGTALTGRLVFPPVVAARSLDIFAALRQALTLLPVEAAGPDLPDQDEQDEPAVGPDLDQGTQPAVRGVLGSVVSESGNAYDT